VLKLYIAYKAETNFVDVVPQKSRLRLTLNMPFHELHDPRGLAKDVTNLGRWGNGDVEVGLSQADELPYVMGLVRQAFEKQMGNGAQQKVLGLLYGQPERSFYIKEILRLTGMGVATIKRELDRMLAAGILRMTRIGNQHHYQANPQCPIYGELLGIVKKTFGVAEVIRRALEPLAHQIDRAFVFGSVASGKETAASDIDLLIIGEVGFAEVVGALHPVQETLGREVNPKIYRREEWNRMKHAKDAFVTEVMPYTEDTLVQQTTAEYLEQELGWESVYAYNNEDFGPDSLLGRESDREVVLTRTLRAKIEELNPGLPATAYDDAVRQIVTVSASQTLAATNREKYELIKDGCRSPSAMPRASGCASGCGCSTSMFPRTTISSACGSCGCGAISTAAGRTSSASSTACRCCSWS
jgi:predicted transport protein/predicted nucleotidyltransferase